MLANDLAETLSLDGSWGFALGEDAAWGRIRVPGCWEVQEHSMLAEGPAQYRRQVPIPASWAGHAIYAEFDAVSYSCTARLNGHELGTHRGMWTPFALDLTPAARPGDENTLELEVYKPGQRYPLRSVLAGFLPDVATTFGGIWQPARLRALTVGIEDLRVDTDMVQQSLRVRGRARALVGEATDLRWLVEARRDQEPLAAVELPVTDGGELDVTLPVPAPMPWSPNHPALYTVQAALLRGSQTVASTSQRVGFRLLSAEGDQLLLNGEPFMVRGILSWGWEPDRIAPAYSAEQARSGIRRVRALGFNTIKLCLFVPNEGFFDVADEEGMLLWQEWPMWLPEVTPELRAHAPGEYAELTRLTQHHPSVALYSLGCELNRAVDGGLLGELEHAVRPLISGALLCDNSGSGESYGGLDFDLADFSDYHPYCDLHYLEPLLDNWRRDWRPSRPWILGEFCDSDTFRDPSEVAERNGGHRPWWLTAENPVTAWREEAQVLLEAEDRLARAQLDLTPSELKRISYAQSLSIRKYTLEALRRRAGIGGYVITGLRDTPIATSGVWDDYGQPKWNADRFLPINSDAMLSLDVSRRRRWQRGGDRPDRLDPYNHWVGEPARWHVILSLTGNCIPAGSQLTWTLVDGAGTQFAMGSDTVKRPLQPGPPIEVGIIDCTMPATDQAAEFRLEVSLAGGGAVVRNDWPVWVYPRLRDAPAGLGVVDPRGLLDDHGGWLEAARHLGPHDDLAPFAAILATAWDQPLRDYLENGGRVLLLQQSEGPLPARGCPFWREAIKLFPPHPVWEVFPQRGYSDLQFLGLACDTAFETARLEQALPGLARFRPILRRLDARRFLVDDYLFEGQLGKGTLVACALRVQGGAGVQPSGWRRNVAGAALLRNLLEYVLCS